MHSFVDRRTHEFFHERDYPALDLLHAIHGALHPTLEQPKEDVLARLQIDPVVFDKALEKLWVHGGARMGPDGVSRGHDDFRDSYVAQRDHKLSQLHQMARFAESNRCRMLHLVQHFGDQADAGHPCGICDICAPDRCVARRFREPSGAERASIAKILGSLARDDGQPTGRLHRETFGDGSLDRRSFEHLLGSLVRAGLARVTEESFEKDGQRIDFQRAWLTESARVHGAASASGRPLSIAQLPPVKKRKKGSKKAGGKVFRKRRKG